MVASFALILLFSSPELKQASSHPMQYYLSLPKGWKPGRKWPVALLIPGAERNFEAMAKEYEGARRDLPFILVTPLVLTDGGAQVRDIPAYQYSAETWKQIDATGPWHFDEAGVGVVLTDVKRVYGGSRVFVTGLEAGGHTVFALMFDHPDWFAGGAPVAPNYAGRWISSRPGRKANVPVRCFVGSEDALWPRFSSQWDRARSEASDRGFLDLSVQTVKGKGHAFLASEVLNWFHSQISH